LRKQRNAPPTIEFEDQVVHSLPDSFKDLSEEYESRIEADKLRSAIQRLSPKLHEIILLREFDDLSCKEIALVLKCPIGTVMSRLHRARTKLRTLLQCSSELQMKIRKRSINRATQ
jgi:RNA polymerase sigma-70 factor (ECF subfamily)